MTLQAAKLEQHKNLNVGCGAHFHPAWCNIDLVASSDEVIQSDIRKGLPFDDCSFDAVYHSHVLEHLSPEHGEKLIRECCRVLAPGGVLRIVVPDLERITTLYLEMLRKAWDGDVQSEENYEWMKLELLDQMVRHKSGGKMGPYMIDTSKANAEFVRSRIGRELDSCQADNVQPANTQTRPGKRTGSGKRIASWFNQLRHRIAVCSVQLFLGQEKSIAFQEGLFRHQGEIHRWMYDRLSLKRLCESCGLSDFQVCRADESSIENFAKYELDSCESNIRKPDSLFIECRKRKAAASRAA